jgi:hypothetical protein
MEMLLHQAVSRALGRKSSRTKRRATWFLLRLVDSSKKSRWILGLIDSAGVLIVGELNTNRIQIGRRLRAKTLRIDCWSLSSPRRRKRRASLHRIF